MIDDIELRSDGSERDDLTPIDLSAIKPSADAERFNRTVRTLGARMTAARARAPRAPLPREQFAATLVAWRVRVGFAAAAIALVAFAAMLRTPRGAEPARPQLAPTLVAAAGLPPQLGQWAERNDHPSAADLIAAFSTRLPTPLYR